MDIYKITDDIRIMLIRSRTREGISQKEMAKALGKSLGTIKNWEGGMAIPNILQILSWFEVLNENPMEYFLTLRYPEIYKNLKHESDDEDIKKGLLNYIENVASPDEIRKLSYCIYGDFGSDWLGKLDMLTAHSHCSTKIRACNGFNIYNNYLMEEARGELIRTDHVMPDKSKLKESIEKCQVAGFNNMNTYN